MNSPPSARESESRVKIPGTMKKISPSHVAPVIAAALMAGCASTGDPNAGGIFWSESKARDRQQALGQEAKTDWSEVDREEAANSHLVEERGSLRAEQQSRLAAIRDQLADLRANAADPDVASSAADLEGKRASLERSGGESAEELQKRVSDLQADVVRLKERNRLLRESH